MSVKTDSAAVAPMGPGAALSTVRARSNLQMAARRFVRQRLAMFGLAITAALLFIAIFAPLIAPAPYDRIDLTNANAFPSGEHWLGTDTVGQDFLSRVI